MGVLVRICQELCRHIAHSSPPCTYRMVSLLHGEIDRYNGVSVSVKDVISPVTSVQDFHDILKESLKKWREEKRTAVWLQMSLDHSRYIEAAAAEGFKFHNAEDRQFLLKLWLRDGEDATPRFATHQLGVCGVVVKEDTKEVLVMQERKSQFSLWKFPGGLADLGENIEWQAAHTHMQNLVFRQQSKTATVYTDLDDVYRLLRMMFALPLLVEDDITQVIGKIVKKNDSNNERLDSFLQYVQTTWIESVLWPVTAWSMYERSLCTYNVEGWHARHA